MGKKIHSNRPERREHAGKERSSVPYLRWGESRIAIQGLKGIAGRGDLMVLGTEKVKNCPKERDNLKEKVPECKKKKGAGEPRISLKISQESTGNQRRIRGF